MPQLGGSHFKNQLPLKDFSWNTTNKTQQLTISGEKDTTLDDGKPGAKWRLHPEKTSA